jgi:hypothetical protein
MALKVPWKALSQRGAFSSKQVAFFAVAGLALVVGVALRAGNFFGQPAEENKAPVAVEASPPAAAASPAKDAAKSVPKTSAPEIPAPKAPPLQQAATEPSKPVEQASNPAAQQAKPEADTAEQSPQPKSADSQRILVSRKPVEVLASPSASAPALYGFPAGRPFRVIGRQAGFAHIQDLRSGASGWIDEAALTAPPPRPAVAAPARSNSGAVSPRPATASKSKPSKKDAQVATDSDNSDSVQPRNRPGLFGGLFGGIFRGGN